MTTAIDRRALLLAAAALPGCSALSRRSRTAAWPSGFVVRAGTRLTLDGEPYRFAGANMWYAAYLGADAPLGDPARLARELDALCAMGVRNVRILASAEEGPLRASIRPAFRNATADYDERLLLGLDRVLAELSRRRLRAVLYLTNFWEWSGGMMTYLSYVNGGRYVDMNDPAHPWPAFANFNAAFYADDRAIALYRDWIRTLVTRVNVVTGVRYADDPTIMAWQLANEPRPAGDLEHADLPRFYDWVQGTAAFIKSLDANQLVSTGSEGLKGALEQPGIVIAEHGAPAIDYLTCHVWPNNWDWVEQTDLAATYGRGEKLTADYISRHVGLAERLGKPLVIEEFGYPRDGGSNDPAASTLYRDRFYGQIYEAALRSMMRGGPIAGTNFWAWNGEARAQHADYRFWDGDRQFMGDPPHEPQGWYGIFSGDTTVNLIAQHARAIEAIVG